MIPQFAPIELEIGLWKGSPIEDGSEIDYEAYFRAWFGEPMASLYGACWGVTNRFPVVFPRAEEPWEITHVAVLAKHYEVLINCAPVSDAVMLFDSVTTPLQTSEIKTVPAGHTLVLQPGSIFVLGGITGEVLDFSNHSKMVS